MRRDTLKTFGAILLILIIVGVTFWYGNRQRQAQVKSDQQAAQQAKKPAPVAQSNKPVPPAAKTPTPAPAAAKPTAPAPVAKAAPTPAPTTTPTATPSPNSTPQTGSDLAYLVPVAALAVGYQVKRASARVLKRSLMAF